jgi:hypothetical protein
VYHVSVSLPVNICFNAKLRKILTEFLFYSLYWRKNIWNESYRCHRNITSLQCLHKTFLEVTNITTKFNDCVMGKVVLPRAVALSGNYVCSICRACRATEDAHCVFLRNATPLLYLFMHLLVHVLRQMTKNCTNYELLGLLLHLPLILSCDYSLVSRYILLQ